MELILQRAYYEEGTNGVLFYHHRFLGFTIELPWLDNAKNISCIPEGTYTLKARYSEKFKHHLHLDAVPGRSLVLIHPANNAQKELQGCIAPVLQLTGIGKGISSRASLEKIISLSYQAFDRKEKVTLIIKS